MSTQLPSVADIVQKWQQNASAASSNYVKGAQRVQIAPGQQAAAKKSKYLQGVQQNVDKWANNVASVSLQSWQASISGKGASNYVNGVMSAQASQKQTAFWNKFTPVLQSAMQAVNAMPSDTYEQRKAKSNAMQDALHQYSNKM